MDETELELANEATVRRMNERRIGPPTAAEQLLNLKRAMLESAEQELEAMHDSYQQAVEALRELIDQCETNKIFGMDEGEEIALDAARAALAAVDARKSKKEGG